MADKLHVGVVRAEIRVVFTDPRTGDAIPLQDYDRVFIRFAPAKGASKERDLLLDAQAVGEAYYHTVGSDFTVAGKWKFQAFCVRSSANPPEAFYPSFEWEEVVASVIPAPSTP
jgi:hypothetical protein